MSATFGAPVSAVLLAIELLLFDIAHVRDPVALAIREAAASASCSSARAMFAMTNLSTLPARRALYMLVGALTGLVRCRHARCLRHRRRIRTSAIHWMWWPAVGAIAVGVWRLFAPGDAGRRLQQTSANSSNNLALNAALFPVRNEIHLVVDLTGQRHVRRNAGALFRSAGMWDGLGALFSSTFPSAGVDCRIRRLVGMAAIFAGPRAHDGLGRVRVETTLQPLGLLPLLGRLHLLVFRSSLIMAPHDHDEKIARARRARAANTPPTCSIRLPSAK